MIDLNGASLYGDGLDIAADNSTVQVQAIDDFSNGIQLESGSAGDLIQGNFIGIDVTGSIEQSNYQGILIAGPPAIPSAARLPRPATWSRPTGTRTSS